MYLKVNRLNIPYLTYTLYFSLFTANFIYRAI